jgi:SNF2 family DNA or RNA helicase
MDLIGRELDALKIPFLRLDGSTRDRASLVERFQSKTSEESVMLISLKAGGVGLNLTAADHVYIMDPWWNPSVEDQAADRAYRIGQQNPVLVHKLVCSGTLEEKILELQSHKRGLARAVLDGGDASAALTREDLMFLLS